MFPIYVGAWTLAYVTIMGSDFRYFLSYLSLAWTGQAGELPGFMHAAGLGCAFVFGLLASVAHFRRKRATGSVRSNEKPGAKAKGRSEELQKGQSVNLGNSIECAPTNDDLASQPKDIPN